MSSTQTGAWVPIALSISVPPATTRSVILGERELVVWRGQDGTAHVWFDRCPHRGMRLSFGFVRNNSLNCLYHGWEYGSNAQCLRIPAHPDLSVPPSIRAKTIAHREAGGLVWASFEGEEAMMPALPQAEPVLSVSIERPFEEVARAIGDKSFASGNRDEGTRVHALSPFAWMVEGSAETAIIGLHPATPDKTMLHLLVAADVSLQERPPVLHRHASWARAFRDRLEREPAAA